MSSFSYNRCNSGTTRLMRGLEVEWRFSTKVPVELLGNIP